jgi:hypothetical protein
MLLSQIPMKKLVIIPAILIILCLLLLLVNTYLVDISSIVFGCVDKGLQGDLPLRHTYTLSDVAKAARQNHIDVDLQTVTYANIPAGAALAPQVQQLLGHDGFGVEETPSGVKHIYGHGLFLKFHDGPATYKMLIRYQPDFGYRQALENISVDGGCAVPNIRIRARLIYMLDQLGVENDMIDQAQILVFSDLLRFP